ncbi:hypothetical protein Hena1_01680 [Erwinia phage Hena1]|uniref:Putative phage tail fibre N-terminal domain-containing protein n=1 Tax=Erwinia phage Hena1 TaxID=2678601 RepID=A0A6B9J6A6_9CAUD|nr:tail fiber protein [Erwinia phage Hena1]QGZ16318.1 hypothetical protein Hena1_01680 [Erwinia phage Hena1]
MSDMSVINSSTSDAIDQLVIDSGRMHKVINGTAVESITVEDGSLIPSLRKALLENLYYKTPVLPWQSGSVTQIFNQLYAFTEPTSGAVSWWYAPSATATNPVSMGDTPATDANWRVVLDSATLTGLYATIDSPNFTGLPTAPTMDADDVSTSIATTAFVNALIQKILEAVDATAVQTATLDVTGDANIFALTAQNATVTEKLTVQDLEILGEVTGIQTSVDGEDIAPKSITTTEKLEVGGDTLLHGAFQLSGNTVTLGDGTLIDLTNIGSSGTLETSFNLDQEVGNTNFIWDTNTLNAPIFGSSGKGITIAKDATNVTQVTWPDNSQSAWVRVMTDGTFGAWGNSIASDVEAVAGTSTDKSLSPKSGKALLANFGIGTQTVQVKTDLNDAVEGEIFAYMAGTTNAPFVDVGGRGILMPSSTGEASMLVLENTNNRLFVRYLTGGVWGDWVEFEGKEGPKGDNGDQGLPGASAYEVYVSTVPEGEDPLEPEEWIASLQGSSFSVNQTGTTAERANYDAEPKGFSFLDTTTGMLYIKNSATSGDWSDGIPFKGDKGDNGTNGATWYTGTTVPAAGTGVNNDLYYLTTTGDVYKKTSGAWAIVGNIKGGKGDDGDPGADGATWFEGSTVPAAALGKNTDLYLHNVTNDVYVKAAGAWTVQTNIKGTKGDDGEQGSVWIWGATPPADTVGRDGDYFLVVPVPPTDSSNGDVYNKASGTWTYIGNIRGADGDGSGTGSDGAKWFNGTGVPVASLGADGDYYLRTTTVSTTAGNGDVYVKASGAWSVTGNIKGADGTGSSYTLPVATATVLGGVKIGSGVSVAADGTISVSGSGGGGTIWLNGTSDPATGTGVVGNYYNNTATGVVFYKTATTTWTQIGVMLPLATSDQAKAATSNLVLSTPARVREYMEAHGFTASYTTTATNLNTVVTGDMFNYDNTTTNTPVASSYGRGIVFPSGTGYVTQLAIENDSAKLYVRYQSNGTWSAWTAIGGGSGSVTFATTAEAQAATSTTVAMSPARVREQFEPLGFGSTYTNEVANLNTLTKGQFFNWGSTSTNTPVASSYGRGIMIPAGVGYATQLGIVNDSGATYVRYNNNGTWTAWVAVGGSGGTAAVMKPSGTGHAAGLAPDPGATAGTTKFLREDATWAVPAGGSGGGSTTFGSALMADLALTAGGKVTSSFVTSGVAIDPTKIYKFSAVLLLRTGAGNTVDINLSDVGPDMFGMSIQYLNDSGAAAMARSEQATLAVTMTLPADVSVVLLDGTMHSSYFGTNGPQVQLATGSSGWGALLKGSCWTMTPVGTYPT